jgi:hypothetical protein
MGTTSIYMRVGPITFSFMIIVGLKEYEHTWLCQKNSDIDNDGTNRPTLALVMHASS